MKNGKLVAAVGAMMLVAPSAMAAANQQNAVPLANGARVGATTDGRQSDLKPSSAVVAALAALAAGTGVAAAAGAFDTNHHHRPVSP